MALTLLLPRADRSIAPYTLTETSPFPTTAAPAQKRVAYAAAHVVADPLVSTMIGPAHLDWDATLAYRQYLWSLGFAVAEAMDTAQRGMGLGWDTTQELIRRTLADARHTPNARIACGAGTDQLPFPFTGTLADVQAAYEEQCSFIEAQGGQIILMASSSTRGLRKDAR